MLCLMLSELMSDLRGSLVPIRKRHAYPGFKIRYLPAKSLTVSHSVCPHRYPSEQDFVIGRVPKQCPFQTRL